MGKEIISSKDLHLYYGKKEALKGIDLTFNQGELTAMIGPSGCGKSTYLRCLNRMNDLIPDVTITGSVVYKGKDIYGPKTDNVELRKEIGMVFQQPNPFPFSVYENVIYGLRLKGVKDKQVLDEAVETSLKAAAVWEDVKDKLHKSALSLSGGQQQRVCIARVLAVEPDIILLDEPTSALDPVSSGKIENMLLTLKEKYTMIMVTHNMSQASRISDKTAFFLQGDLIEINDMEVKLEKKSFEMIALQQPVTTDLRMIITVMKASSDLERMADHAVSIAKSTIRLKGETRIPEIEKEISDMSDYVKKMVDNVLIAYVKTDQKDARMIAQMDDRTNEYFDSIYKHAVEAMKANPETVISGTDYLHVAQYLERIGDYVTNICEWIVYLATGKITELNSNRDEQF